MNKLSIKHPGEILKNDFLIPMGITVYNLSKSIGVSQTRISNIIKGSLGVTADTALRLSKFFSTTSELWMNLQTAYELEKEWVKKRNEYKQIEPFKFAINPDFKQTKTKSQILKKFGEEISYADRVYLLYFRIWETGMEYPILLQSKPKLNLDAFEWYDDIIKIPKYKNELTLKEKKMLLKLSKIEMYKTIIKQANEREAQEYNKNTELEDIDVDTTDETEPSKSNPREG